MKNKIIIFILLFFQCSILYAQDDPVIRNIKKGEPAPYDGVILNYSAADKVLNESNKIAEECKINMEEKEELLKEKYSYETDICNIELKMEINKNNQLMQIKDEHIKELEDIAAQDDWSNLYFVGGFIGGALITSLIILMAN